MQNVNPPMRITCARCNHSVEKIEIFPTPSRYQIVVRAFCHGEVDERTTDIYFMGSARSSNFSDVVAFDVAHIEAV